MNKSQPQAIMADAASDVAKYVARHSIAVTLPDVEGKKHRVDPPCTS